MIGWTAADRTSCFTLINQSETKLIESLEITAVSPEPQNHEVAAGNAFSCGERL